MFKIKVYKNGNIDVRLTEKVKKGETKNVSVFQLCRAICEAANGKMVKNSIVVDSNTYKVTAEALKTIASGKTAKIVPVKAIKSRQKVEIGEPKKPVHYNKAAFVPKDPFDPTKINNGFQFGKTKVTLVNGIIYAEKKGKTRKIHVNRNKYYEIANGLKAKKFESWHDVYSVISR